MLVGMRIRGGAYGSGDAAGTGGDSRWVSGGGANPGGGSRSAGMAGRGQSGWVNSWRVPAKVTIAKACGLIGFVIAGAVLVDDRSAMLVSAIAVLVLGALVLRDVLVPVRLATDDTGITVATGFAGRVAIGWATLTTVRVCETRRLGLRSRTLEVDAVEGLHLFGEYDLDGDLDGIAAVVEELRGRFLNHQSSP